VSEVTTGRWFARSLERLALPLLLLLAAVMRLPDLATRGTWDADQGHDMLVLRLFVRDGIVPLLGPPTSIGDVHHGAWYYYLLSPVAALTGGDSPLAVVAAIAVAGIVAVGVVWWLARSIGGPIAGSAAGLLMAVSAAAIDESTFIWNPNLIALSSAVALAAAWRGWSGGDRRWWIVAAIGTAITMQCHVLGVALLPIVGAPFVLDARRRSMGSGVIVGVVGVFVAAYLPLAVNEATTGFSETRAAIDYLAGGRGPAEAAIPIRFGIVGLRVVSWPLSGLITAGFAAGGVVLVGIVAIVVWLGWGRGAGAGSGRVGSERFAARWFGLGLVWSIAFLTIAAPSLASVVVGLPNDHYHAFADPPVFVLAGLGIGRLARTAAPIGPALAALGVVTVVGWNLLHLPPAIHPDGGFPAGAVTAERVDAVLTRAGITRTEVIEVRSLPTFKSTEAVAYPLAGLGRRYIATVPKGVAPGSVDPALDPGSSSGETSGLVLLCDDLFRASTGAACGGPAERSVAPDAGGAAWGALLDRFEAAPGRFVSIYGTGSG
jgi:4-amino-4-deoxy-L-arabinose transferase-like glycosyltransferase